MITDLGSTNGTFIGVIKIDCKAHPSQVLADGELLFLGKEPFLVRLIKNEKPVDTSVTVEKNQRLSNARPVKRNSKNAPTSARIAVLTGR